MKVTNLIVLIILSLMIISCGQVSSDDVNPDIIQTDYSALYSEDNNTLEVTGSFTVGGNSSTYVDLILPAYLNVNGNQTKRDSNLAGQISYKYEKYYLSVNNVGTIRLEYNDPEERRFFNSITMPSEVSFSTNTFVQEDSDLIISYSVFNVFDGAKNMYLSVETNNGWFSRYIEATQASGNYTITAQDLKIYKGQLLAIKLCRSKSTKVLDHPGEGGRVSSSYCAKTQSVSIR